MLTNAFVLGALLYPYPILAFQITVYISTRHCKEVPLNLSHFRWLLILKLPGHGVQIKWLCSTIERCHHFQCILLQGHIFVKKKKKKLKYLLKNRQC